MDISVIIPAYNNVTTVSRVIAAAQAHPSVAEVIVVCDASEDGTERVLKRHKGITLIRRNKRSGKGSAVVAGWNTATHDVLLGLDADLASISVEHIDRFVQAFATGRWDMVIGETKIGGAFSAVSGNRMYRKSVVLPFQSLAQDAGYGIEQVINYAHQNKRVHMVNIEGAAHVLKYHRHAPHTAAWLYAKEGWELAKTEYRLGFPVTRGSLTTARGFILGINILRGMTKYF